MKGVIIGAGIGGLTTAIALQRQGIEIEIYEAAPALKPVGAGIVMASNAMQVFRRLGIDRKIMEAGMEIHHAMGVDHAFKVISGVDVRGKLAPRYGIGSFALHRGRLQQALLSELGSGKVHLNKELDTVIQHADRPELRFKDGSSATADFVIGADGIKSAVRRSLMGEVPFRYSGQTCWRGMTSFMLPGEMKNNSYEMWGNQKGLRFGFVPTSENEVYYFTTFFAPPNGKDQPDTVKKNLGVLYSCFGELACAIINATPEENIIRSDIYDFAPINRWWSGQVALLGDAAHATTPNLGQGGCQAVEDAYVIAACLKGSKSPEEAFKRYQGTRIEKATHVVNLSWRFGQMTNLGSPVMRSLRNGMMRMLPEKMTLRALDKILRLNY